MPLLNFIYWIWRHCFAFWDVLIWLCQPKSHICSLKLCDNRECINIYLITDTPSNRPDFLAWGERCNIKSDQFLKVYLTQGCLKIRHYSLLLVPCIINSNFIVFLHENFGQIVGKNVRKSFKTRQLQP